MGRSSEYSPETGIAICTRLAGGESLVKICLDDAMPAVPTVYRWMMANEEFRNLYARAREDQADTLADEIIEIADDGARDYSVDSEGREIVNHDHITRSRLRVDARKWIASKLKPKKYGERVENHISGDLTLSQLLAPKPDG